LEIIGFGGLFRHAFDKRKEEMDAEDGTIGLTTPFPEWLSLHREIYTPVLRLQSSQSTSLDSDLLPEDSNDDEELFEQLREEEELNRRDREVEEDYEKRLWGDGTGGDEAVRIVDGGVDESDDESSDDQKEMDDADI
jgi:hypothetical protein